MGGGRPQRAPKGPELMPTVEKERVSNYDPNKKMRQRQHDPEHQPVKNRKQLARDTGYGMDDDIVIHAVARIAGKLLAVLYRLMLGVMLTLTHLLVRIVVGNALLFDRRHQFRTLRRTLRSAAAHRTLTACRTLTALRTDLLSARSKAALRCV